MPVVTIQSRGRTKLTFGAVHVLLEVTTSVSTGCISSVRSMTQSAASVPPVASSPPSGLSARQWMPQLPCSAVRRGVVGGRGGGGGSLASVMFM